MQVDMINHRILIWMDSRMDQEIMKFKIFEYLHNWIFLSNRTNFVLFATMYIVSLQLFLFIYTIAWCIVSTFISLLYSSGYWKLWFVWLSDVWYSLKEKCNAGLFGIYNTQQFFFKKWCVTIGNICVTNQIFHCYELCSL